MAELKWQERRHPRDVTETLVLAAYLAKFGGLPLTLRRQEESLATYASRLDELPATD
jgi:hypothetical protein